MTSTQHVQMEVGNGLACIGTGVDDEAVSAVLDTELDSELSGNDKEMSKQKFIPCADLVRGGDVLFRYNEYVNGRDWVNILKGDAEIILIQDRCRLRARYNVAENTIRHSAILFEKAEYL